MCAVEVQFVCQFALEFFHPPELGQPFEAVQQKDSLFETVQFLVRKRHVGYRKVRSLVGVVHFPSVTCALDGRTEACFALHVIEVVEDLAAADGDTFGESTVQGFLAGLTEVFPIITAVLGGQAFVYCAVTHVCTFVLSHGIICFMVCTLIVRKGTK